MIVRTPIAYAHDTTTLDGLLIRDPSLPDPLPGVLLFHEFTGPGPYMLPHAERLAQAGYAAFLCDMYGKGIRPATKAEASTQSRIYRQDRLLMRARARAGIDALLALGQTMPDRLFALGFSFGGCAALELLRSGAPIAGAISFYGYLNTTHPCAPMDTHARALILHGAQDRVVPMAELPVFEKEMRTAGVEYELVVYEDAGHGFANTSHEKDTTTGSWYCKDTSAHAWARTLEFLAKN